MTVRVELRRDAGRFDARSGPWIRARQIAKVAGPPDPAGLAQVVDRTGETVAWGLISPESEIRVRLLGLGSPPPDPDWLSIRIDAALGARPRLGLGQDTTGFREINSEGDGLPGLVVDRYGDDRVVQLGTAPMVARREAIVAQLGRDLSGQVVVVVPEGAAQREGVQAGVSEHGLESLRFTENGLQFRVGPPPGQKTGAYFDQRQNHRIVADLAAAHGGPVLDLGCYVGGFALPARARGLDVVGADQSQSALDRAAANEAANGLRDIRWIATDMFGPMDDPTLAGPFGTIVADPPKIARTKGQRDRAVRSLDKMVRRLVPRLADGGFLVLCSCSHHVGREQMDAVVAAAASGALTRVQNLGPGPDHPVWPGHVEGDYLRVNVYQRR